MSKTFLEILRLVQLEDIKISDHGYDELAADGLLAKDVVSSIADAVVVEDYPEYPKGSCVLVLQKDHDGIPVHVVWGIPKGAASPAVLITAYRPSPSLWEDGFTRRKK